MLVRRSAVETQGGSGAKTICNEIELGLVKQTIARFNAYMQAFCMCVPFRAARSIHACFQFSTALFQGCSCAHQYLLLMRLGEVLNAIP